MVPVQVFSTQGIPEVLASSLQGRMLPGPQPTLVSAHPARLALRVSRPLTLLALCAVLGLTTLLGCSGKKKPVAGEVPHENYGGCQVQGRHYHNTHVYIGDRYEPSLTEWLKY